MWYARRIRLRREARDESSARNSVSCVTCNDVLLPGNFKINLTNVHYAVSSEKQKAEGRFSIDL